MDVPGAALPEAATPLPENLGTVTDVAAGTGAATGDAACGISPITWAILAGRVGGYFGYRMLKRHVRLRANMLWDKDGFRFGWKRSSLEHPKLYPYYYYRECFEPTFGKNQPNPLFMTALVKNGAGTLRYSTKDSHFDKIGSVKRSFYIPDGTRVQVLCQEEKLTLQHLYRLGKLVISQKFTVVWNNRYRLKEEALDLYPGLNKDTEVTLVKFAKKKGWWEKRAKFLTAFMKPFSKSRRQADRYWRVKVIDKDGEVQPDYHEINEEHLEHVGNKDRRQVRDNGANWKTFEMLGNVNHCNLTELSSGNGKWPIQHSDVPGYGEVYDHCCTGNKPGEKRCQGVRVRSSYKCNFCVAIGKNKLAQMDKPPVNVVASGIKKK